VKKSITAQVEEHVEAALDANVGKDQVEWFVAPAMGPNGEVTHFVTIVMSSPLLGKSIQAGGVMIGAEVNGTQISNLIQQALEHCRESRSRVLSEALSAGAPEHQDLIIPPR
jgi:hypothetical protein